MDSRLRLALRSPNLALRHLNRLYYEHLFKNTGSDFFDRDWDNLLLLDACRYDMFEQYADLPGTLDSVRSRGSGTVEFLAENCDGREFHDTVYVTANPQLYRNWERIDVSFHDVIDVWHEDGWDPEVGTVMPSTMVEYAREAVERYPDKRLLVHFLQPHYPFVTTNSTLDKGHLEKEDAGGMSVWMELMTGNSEMSKQEVWEAYIENLHVVLPHVEDLMTSLEGKTVVSSDHGNMVGERARPIPIREWGHPLGIHTEQLVKVPWLEYENGDRREILPEPPSDRSPVDGSDDGIAEDRLRDLGYL